MDRRVYETIVADVARTLGLNEPPPDAEVQWELFGDMSAPEFRAAISAVRPANGWPSIEEMEVALAGRPTMAIDGDVGAPLTARLTAISLVVQAESPHGQGDPLAASMRDFVGMLERRR